MRPPISDPAQISAASAATLQQQLCFELYEVKERLKCSNSELAARLHYANASTVTKWLTGQAVVSVSAARRLDELGEVTSIEATFTELRDAYTRASMRRGRAPSAGAKSFDVFLASPMASTGTRLGYESERSAARDVKLALETWCGFSVYYAGDAIETDADFDTPEMAAETNFEVLSRSHFFLLLTLTQPADPSSVYVEAGYALARHLPSLYLVAGPEVLPFVLRTLGQHQQQSLPPVSLQFVDGADQAVAFVKRNGAQLFERLNGLSRRKHAS